MHKGTRSLIVAAGLALSCQAFAADLPTAKPAPPAPAPAPPDWHFDITLDGWAPSMSSEIGVRTYPTATSNVGFFQLLDHTEGIFPASVAAYNNTFILGADLFWTKVEVGSTFGPGLFGGVHASTTINNTLATVYGGVKLPIGSPNLSVYGTVGARIVDVSTSVDLSTPIPGFSPSASGSKTWVDPIVGLNARYKIDDKWSLHFIGDGGGYPGSGTWQAFGAVDYKWTPQFTTSLGFRALYVYDQSGAKSGNGSFRFGETLYGPEVDFTYSFF